MSLPRSTQEWGENTRRLWRGIAAMGPFFILARVLTAGAQILAGRWLGPREFGLATLVVAAAGVLFIPLTVGFPAALVKLASLEVGGDQRARVVSTSLWMQSVWGFACVALLRAMHSPLSQALRLDAALFSWCLVYAGLLTFYTFVSTALVSVMLFEKRGKIEFFYGMATLLLMLGGFRFAPRNFGVFIGAMDAALLLASACCLYHLRNFLKPIIDASIAKQVLSYSIPIFIAGCSGAVIQGSSPLILASQLSAREVGYFGAYTMGSLSVAMVVFQILNAVLAPLASAPSRHEGVWRKFFFLLIPLGAVSFISFCSAQVVMLRLMGKGYPIDACWIGLFSAVGVAYLLFFCASTLLGLRDVGNAWLGTAGVIITGIGCLLGNLWAIPIYGFSGSAIGLIIGYGAGFLWCAYWGWRGIWKGRSA